MNEDAARSRRGQVGRVEVETKNGVAVIPLSFTDQDDSAARKARASALKDACRRLSEDETVRAVLLQCAGQDLRVALDETPSPGDLAALGVASAVASLPQPVVATLRGNVLDQGLEIALSADIRIAADDARFAMTAVMRGRLPFDGGTQRLPRIVGPGTAADMLLAGRALDAQAALTAGLVTEVVPPDELDARGLDLARRIAARGALAARYAKEAVRAGLDMTLEQGLGLEADLSILLHTSPERAEGLAAFLERRPPRFPPDLP